MHYLGIIGSARCSKEISKLAEEVGREVALSGSALICGGREGVMEAAARGAHAAGGLVIGILPGHNRHEGNPYLSVAIATGLGDARNAIIACASDALIAIAGGYGTLSEIGLALKMGKPVIGLGTWKLQLPDGDLSGIIETQDPKEAVVIAISKLNTCYSPEED